MARRRAGAAPGPAGRALARPRRAWLWTVLLLIMLVSLLVGIVLRAGVRGGGGPTAVMIGVFGLLAVVYLAGEVMVILQDVQAREAGGAALAGLPDGFRISGRVRVSGLRGRPVCIDHVVVGPGDRAFAVVLDGSTRPPSRRDPLDGLGPLLGRARAAADALSAAARARVLPDRLGLDVETTVRPCILVVRRPLVPGERSGVLALAAGDAVRVLAGR